MGSAEQLRICLLVGVGGFFGAIARYVVGFWISGRAGSAWPWATFVINITGSFFIGMFFAWSTARGTSDAWRFLVPIGFIGAYTTFSTYALETVRLAEGGSWSRAASYLVASTICGLAAVLLGAAAGKRFV